MYMCVSRMAFPVSFLKTALHLNTLISSQRPFARILCLLAEEWPQNSPTGEGWADRASFPEQQSFKNVSLEANADPKTTYSIWWVGFFSGCPAPREACLSGHILLPGSRFALLAEASKLTPNGRSSEQLSCSRNVTSHHRYQRGEGQS